MSRLFIAHHLGLGDHIICNGLYRVMLERHARCLFIVKWHNYRTVRQMLSDCTGLWVVPFPARFADQAQRLAVPVFRALGWKILALGFFGSNYFASENTKSFDEQFYDQAEIPFSERWNRFSFYRDSQAEEVLLSEMVDKAAAPVFIHDDKERNFRIDEGFINSIGPIIRPVRKRGFSFLSYAAMLEYAQEIHVIESSFLALAESLNVEGAKFVHEYARPETSLDARHRQTLRGNWSRIEK